MFDRYTKIVLTVIAVALSAIAVQGAIGPARAQMAGCGMSASTACYVGLNMQPGDSLDVTVVNTPLDVSVLSLPRK